MSPMPTLTAAACLLALCACATAPRGFSHPPVLERTVALADLLGQSPAEVRERLLAREPDHDYVSAARLTQDGEVVTRESLDVMRGGGLCAIGSSLRFRLQGDRSLTSFPRFVFQDGRLQKLLPLTGDDPIPADGRIMATCRPPSSSNPADEVLGLAILGPWAAAVAVGRIPETVERASARAELAKLRLGEPPPGGLAAYATSPPAGVQVQLQGTGGAVITVDLGRDRITHRAAVKIEVAEGRIVSVAKAPLNFVPCWIEIDRAFHCGATAAAL